MVLRAISRSFFAARPRFDHCHRFAHRISEEILRPVLDFSEFVEFKRRNLRFVPIVVTEVQRHVVSTYHFFGDSPLKSRQ